MYAFFIPHSFHSVSMQHRARTRDVQSPRHNDHPKWEKTSAVILPACISHSLLHYLTPPSGCVDAAQARLPPLAMISTVAAAAAVVEVSADAAVAESTATVDAKFMLAALQPPIIRSVAADARPLLLSRCSCRCCRCSSTCARRCRC
jgi:hypothetical protein